MPTQKHILFISSWYPRPDDPSMGIFNRYFALAAALYNKVTVLNVSPDINAGAKSRITKEESDNVFTVQVQYKKVNTTIPLLDVFIKRLRVLRAFEAGYQAIVRERGIPDIIHLNVVMPMGIGALRLSGKYGIPMVINENWSGYCAEDGRYRGPIQKYYTKKIVRHAKTLMPTSTFLRDAMLAHGLKGNYKIIPNVVNVTLFKPDPGPGRQQGTRLIHISSLNDQEKNVSGLIRAFASQAKTDKSLFLDIVGEGVDKPKYLQLVSKLGIGEQVRFAGRLFGKDLVKAINAADALIMFSHFETFCLVIIEAFACGKPVITSAAGAISSYMQPFLGLMVEVRDEEALGAAITEFALTKNNYDPEKIRQYAVDHYSYEKVGRDLDLIYNEAIGDSK